MTTHVLLGEVLTEIKSGIGSDWSKYPVHGATRVGLAPAKERPGKNPERYKPVVSRNHILQPDAYHDRIGSLCGRGG